MPEFTGRLRTPRLASAPSSPVVGEMYYNTADNLLYHWNGTVWASGGGAGVEAFEQTGDPGGSAVVGDIWIDTDEPSPTTFFPSMWVTVLPLYIGAWPKTQTLSLPFKADVLLHMSATLYVGAVGMRALRVTWNGVAQLPEAGQYFNETSSHKTVATEVVIRGAAAGNHTVGIQYAGYTQELSDSGDYGRIGVTAVQVP